MVALARPSRHQKFNLPEGGTIYGNDGSSSRVFRCFQPPNVRPASGYK